MPKAPKPIAGNAFEVELFGKDKVEIGDKDSPDFKPYIKLNRWDGECFIKVSLPTTEKVSPIVEGNKVKFNGADIEAHFYPLEPTTVIAKDKEGNDVPFTQNELGGFEFEVILKKKPLTNKIVLNIETQELKFYYQPALTQEEIDEGVIRPDNIVGSYAVYHATKRDHIVGQTNYKAGKAFHIYRPKITDAEGKWVWGELNLDEQASTLTTTIPQEFLDTAVYPVSVDPTFGDTERGASTAQSARIRGWKYTCPEEGTGVSMGGWIDAVGAGVKGKFAIYDTNGDFIQQTLEGSLTGELEELILDFVASVDLISADYGLAVWGDSGISSYLDTVTSATKYINQAATYDTWVNITYESGTRAYSFYCTYEVAAPPGQPYISRVQGVQGMRSWGGI